MSVAFTKNNTLNEIISQAGKEMSLFFPEALLRFIPEEYRSLPLSQWAENYIMPWGLPFPADDLLASAALVENARELWDWVPLWEQRELDLGCNDWNSVGLMVPKCVYEGIRSAVIVCPGGAYESLSFFNEGYETAKRLEGAGYRSFVLNYRCSPNRYPSLRWI